MPQSAVTPLSAVTLRDRDRVETIRRACGHRLSAHAFASLYLWQEQMGLSLALGDGAFFVKSGWQGGNAWFFPCGEESEKRDFLDRHREETDFTLHFLRRKDVAWLEAVCPGQWCFRRAEAFDEYIYNISEHLALQGRDYANMRTQVHKVEREYRPRTALLDGDTAADVLGILRDWSHGEHRFVGVSLRDDAVDDTAIRQREALSFTGVAVYLDGVPAGVAAGFPLTGDTFDIVVAKCTENLQGLSYYVKRELMKTLEGRFTYVNLEEDLGLPGLRTMKAAIHPVEKNEIWEATPAW